MAFINDGSTTRILNALLAKHDIKVGKKLTSDDLCNLDGITGQIENIEVNNITGTMDPWDRIFGIHNNQTNIKDKASEMIGKYTTAHIVKHQEVDVNKLESLSEKKAREASITEKKRRKVVDILTNEIKNNIWL